MMGPLTGKFVLLIPAASIKIILYRFQECKTQGGPHRYAGRGLPAGGGKQPLQPPPKAPLFVRETRGVNGF